MVRSHYYDAKISSDHNIFSHSSDFIDGFGAVDVAGQDYLRFLIDKVVV